MYVSFFVFRVATISGAYLTVQSFALVIVSTSNKATVTIVKIRGLESDKELSFKFLRRSSHFVMRRSLNNQRENTEKPIKFRGFKLKGAPACLVIQSLSE